VALIPEVAGSPLPTVCSSWHKHTGLLVTTLPRDVQHSTVGGVVSFAITYAKQDCSNANSLEQSTESPTGPGAGAGSGTGACAGMDAIGDGGCVGTAVGDGARGLLSNVGHLDVSPLT